MREQQLIQQARCGDADACARLVREHYAKVYRLLAHLTRDTHAAEDLCQETFAAAWSRLATFEGHSSFGTWLHRIAYRRFLDWLQAKQRAGKANLIRDRSAADIDPLAAISMDDDARALYAALDRIDQPHRDVLVLHYLLDFSYQEMSAILDEPVGTMKWRTRVAIEEIRKVLGETGTRDAERQREKPGAPAASAPTAADPRGA